MIARKSWSRIVTDSTYYFSRHGVFGRRAWIPENQGALRAWDCWAQRDKGLTWSFKITEYRGFMQIFAERRRAHVSILGDDEQSHIAWTREPPGEQRRNRSDMVRGMVFSDIIHGWSVGDRGLLRNTV